MQKYFQEYFFERTNRFCRTLTRLNCFRRINRGVRRKCFCYYKLGILNLGMKNLVFIIILLALQSCLVQHRVDVWKTITIASEEKIVINEVKSPVSLEIKNLSNEALTLISNLNTPQNIMPHSVFNYRLPKKSSLILKNETNSSVSIYLHYSSNKTILVNNKELQ